VSTRKGQNSILFLTTLGVYLGLVLVGAAPQAVAHPSATTRNFELTDEIEFKDDLDKKPDPADALLAHDAIANRSRERYVSLAIFLKQFKPFANIGVLGMPVSHFAIADRLLITSSSDGDACVSVVRPRSPQLSVLHLPRASIDDFVNDAK
jgi:hypothetical protein